MEADLMVGQQKPDTYIGNGPYVMDEWVHDAHITFKKNSNYWNKDEIGPEAIKFLLMDDDSAVLAAFENGEILLADTFPTMKLRLGRIRKSSSFKVNLVPTISALTYRRLRWMILRFVGL